MLWIAILIAYPVGVYAKDYDPISLTGIFEYVNIDEMWFIDDKVEVQITALGDGVLDCNTNSVCLEGGFNGTIVSINQMFHLVFYKSLTQFELSTLQVKGDTLSYQGPMFPGAWEFKGSVKGQLNCSITSNLCNLSINVKTKTNNGAYYTEYRRHIKP